MIMPLSSDIAKLWESYGYVSSDVAEFNSSWKSITVLSNYDRDFFEKESKKIDEQLTDIRKDIHIMESVMEKYNTTNDIDDFEKQESIFFSVRNRIFDKIDRLSNEINQLYEDLDDIYDE